MVKLKVGQPGPPTTSYTYERTPWVRPSDWLTMPTVTETDDKVVMLVAVYPDAPTYEVFRFYSQDINTNVGTTYQVDWGDGNIETVDHALDAYHTYNYTDLGLASAPVTSEGWKQVLITITPTEGSSFRRLDYHRSHPEFINITFPNRVKEIIISTPYVSGPHWYLGGSRNFFGDCKKATIIKTGAITTAYNTFNSFYSLEEVDFEGMDLSAATNISGMFSSCYKIQEIPNHFGDTSHIQYFDVLFNFCPELLSLPEVDTSNALGMYYYIRDCRKLKEAHVVVPSTCRRCERIFENCHSLEKVTGSFDFTGITISYGVVNMFAACISLKEIPFTFDCSVVERLDAFCSNMYWLETPPTFINTSNVTNFSSMFTSCTALKRAPELDTSSAIYVNDMFSGCANLAYVPEYDFSSAQQCIRVFNSCWSVTSYPDFDFSSATTIEQAFYNNRNLINFPNITTSTALTSIKNLLSFSYNVLSVPYFETANVTTFYSAFRYCFKLDSLPNFNTSNVTDFFYAMDTMYNLKELPNWDTSSGTDLRNFAYANIRATSMPAYDLSSATNLTNAFRNMPQMRVVPAINIPSSATATDIFRDSFGMDRIEAVGIGQTTSVYNCNLGEDNLNYFFDNLATVSGKTVAIGLNPGTATCDRTIATAKGWTVSG
jgi:surface protein